MRTVFLVLGAGAALALLQQQWLLRRPPRLLELTKAPASSGPAALDLRFSRPMDRAAVAAATRLEPRLPHRWFGAGNPLRLLVEQGWIEGPLRVEVAGRDRRGRPMPPARWIWDPRPRALAAMPIAGGVQLRLQAHDGRWRTITPPWPAIPSFVPLGDGSGVAYVSRDAKGRHWVWRVPLLQRNLAPLHRGLAEPVVGRTRALLDGPVRYAHLATNRAGELLIQSTALDGALETTQLIGRDGRRQVLPFEAGGAVELLPQGSAVVVPRPGGLALQPLPGRGGPAGTAAQILPGSRDLSSFCPVGGRALLVRHWPDFRRSLELVEPGAAPRQLWLDDAALLASACERGGEGIWILVMEGLRAPRLGLLKLDRRGRVLARRDFGHRQVEAGTGLFLDPTRRQLLLVLRPSTPARSAPAAARVTWIDADSLAVVAIGPPAREVKGLPAG